MCIVWKKKKPPHIFNTDIMANVCTVAAVSLRICFGCEKWISLTIVAHCISSRTSHLFTLSVFVFWMQHIPCISVIRLHSTLIPFHSIDVRLYIRSENYWYYISFTFNHCCCIGIHAAYLHEKMRNIKRKQDQPQRLQQAPKTACKRDREKQKETERDRLLQLDDVS